MTSNLYDILASHFPADRIHICLETPDGLCFTYRELEEQSARMANVLTSLGIAPGDRVAAQVEKSPHALFLYLACLRAGGIYLPLNPAYTQEELEYFLDDATPGILVCQPERKQTSLPLCRARGLTHLMTLGCHGEGSLLERIQGMPGTFATSPTSENDVAAILYSSGTTGKPKGAMLTHRNLSSNAEALTQLWEFSSHDVLLHALPIFHVHGLFVALHCALLSGARMLFLPRFEAAQVSSLLPRATVMMGVPTYYSRLLAHSQFGREACRGMRVFISGSAPLLPETFAEFEQRTGHRIVERYGLTETVINTSNPLNGARVPGTVGLPLHGVEVRIAREEGTPLPCGETGEIQVRGPNVFAGYWSGPDLSRDCFTSDGFFRTGDLGKVDDRGHVTIVGRSKDLIISGGLNVFPKEIEDCINQLDGVQESAVVGMPHADFGEAALAIIVARPGASVDLDAVNGHLRTSLARFKLPKLLVMADELPRNSMGKVQKNLLRGTYRKWWDAHLK
jgi:malonyl-CoA/methylmalonyl-CoA synthetase